MTLTYTLNYP